MSKYTDDEIAKADGSFEPPMEFTAAYLAASIARIEIFPHDLENVMKQLDPTWLDLPYRVGGWKLKQVIHHIADSHMQAFTRFKLTLTEDTPTIKPYIQNAWAETADSEMADANVSVTLIKALHQRFVILMKHMKEEDFEKCYIHPEYNKTFSLAHVVGLYAWHGHHHLRQIEMFMENKKA